MLSRTSCDVQLRRTSYLFKTASTSVHYKCKISIEFCHCIEGQPANKNSPLICHLNNFALCMLAPRIARRFYSSVEAFGRQKNDFFDESITQEKMQHKGCYAVALLRAWPLQHVCCNIPLNKCSLIHAIIAKESVNLGLQGYAFNVFFASCRGRFKQAPIEEIAQDTPGSYQYYVFVCICP